MTERIPFDRVEHNRRAGAAGGRKTAETYGPSYMREIGRRGAATTMSKYGVDRFQGIVKAKGWDGRKRPNLAVDLAAGQFFAALAE